MGERIRLCHEFYMYQRDEENETLGQFMANYHSLWTKASEHGVTGSEAIMHLIPQLPAEWQEWAVTLVPQYMDVTFFQETLYGDIGGFIGVLSQQFFSLGGPPPGPHHMPEVQLQGNYELPENPIPFVFHQVEPQPNLPQMTAPMPNPEFPVFAFDHFPSPPTEIAPFEPCMYFSPHSPDPRFQDLTHEYLYQPTKKDEAGPSRRAGDLNEDEETASNAAEDEVLNQAREERGSEGAV